MGANDIVLYFSIFVTIAVMIWVVFVVWTFKKIEK